MILCGVAFILCILFYRPPPPAQHQGKTRWQLLAELDYVGMILFAGGLGVLLMGVIWAAGEYNSRNIHIVLPLVIGLVSLAACGVWQFKMGDKGLIPPRLFIGKTRSFTLPIIVSGSSAWVECQLRLCSATLSLAPSSSAKLLYGPCSQVSFMPKT